MPKLAVHFGAGNIGRGFLGQLYRENDYEIIFLDLHDDTIEKLKNAKSYNINKVDADGKDVKSVSKFRAIYSNANPIDAMKAIARADIFTCSVGPRRLKKVGPILAGGIDRRDPKLLPLAVIACENDQNATDHLRKYVKCKAPEEEVAGKVEWANCAIDRIVPNKFQKVGLDVTIEKYFDWTIEQGPLKLSRPTIKGINWVDKLEPYLERKLFTVNTGHASTAYLGWAAGYATIHEALKDPNITETVNQVLMQNAVYLQENYDFTCEEQEQYIKQTIRRFQNPALNDPCKRVARDPMRKLSSKERLMKPAKWLAEHGYPYDALLIVIEQAFRFQSIEDDPQSSELAKVLATRSAESATKYVTKLTADHPLFPDIVKIVKRVQESGSGSNGSGSGADPQSTDLLSRRPRGSQGPLAVPRNSTKPNQQSVLMGTSIPPRQMGASMGRTPGRTTGRQGPPPRGALPQQTLPIRRPVTRPHGAGGPSAPGSTLARHFGGF